MKSCLSLLAALAIAGFLLLWFALPAAAGILAVNALQSAGLSGTGLAVDVQSNPPPRLLFGHADTVRVRCTDATLQDLRAGTVDITLANVNLFDRSVGTVDGTLQDVRVATPDGSVAVISRATLAGDATAATAQLLVSTDEATRLAESRFAAVAGIHGNVAFAAPNRVTISAAGRQVGATLTVQHGSLVLKPDLGTLPVVSLIDPGAGNPFDLTGVAVSSDGLLLTGSIDVQSLLQGA